MMTCSHLKEILKNEVFKKMRNNEVRMSADVVMTKTVPLLLQLIKTKIKVKAKVRRRRKGRREEKRGRGYASDFGQFRWWPGD